MAQTNLQVDGYLRKNKKWQEPLKELRRICLACDLTEDIKWRHPCYTVEGSNIVILGAFKEYCAMTFVKGSLLKDPRGILKEIGPNTQAGRVVRFTDAAEVLKTEPALKACIREAIEVEKSGVKIKRKPVSEHQMPVELQNKLTENRALKGAFAALTPGRQRGYLLYFSSAKQSKTREARIEKHLHRILSGKGLDD